MSKLVDWSSGSPLTKYNTFLAKMGDPIAQTVKLGQKALKTKTPELKPPTVMPDTDDEAVKAARRRQIAEVQSRSGRASTILSQSDTLGG